MTCETFVSSLRRLVCRRLPCRHLSPQRLFKASLAKPFSPVKPAIVAPNAVDLTFLKSSVLAFFWRNNRQQQIGPCSAAEMQAGHPVVNPWRTVARIVVEERAAAGELVLEIRQPPAAASGIDVVLPTDGQADAVTGGHDDRGRPDFDIEFDDQSALEQLLLVVGMIGPVRPRQLAVEPAMRSAQPAL